MILEILKEITGYNDFRQAKRHFDAAEQILNSISADEEGLWLDGGKKIIEWDDVVSIQEVVHDDDEETEVEYASYLVTLRGGLVFGGFNEDGTIDEYIDSPCAELVDFAALDEEDTSRGNLKCLMGAVTDIGFSEGVATWLRKIKSLSEMVCEGELLRQMVGWTGKVSVIKDGLKSKDAIRRYQHEEDALCESIQEQLPRVEFDEDLSDIMGKSFFWLAYRMLRDENRGVKDQVRQFELYHAALLYWPDMGEEVCVESLIPDEDEHYPPFGDAAWKNERKMIVCSDERPDHRAVAEGKHVKGVMIMSSEVLEAYNAQCERNCQLIFENSHPRNGFTYIQNPLNQREYFEASSYKENLLDQKFSELCRLLTCLGATKISASVESEKSSARGHAKRRDVSASGNYSGVKGNANVRTAGEETEDNALYRKYAQSFVLHPVGKPHVPKDLLFYSSESSWRRLAEYVLEGRIEEATVDMTFKDEQAFSRKRISDINLEIQSLIPGYVMGGGAGYSSEEKNEGKDRSSLVWHYNVTFNPAKNHAKCGQGATRRCRG